MNHVEDKNPGSAALPLAPPVRVGPVVIDPPVFQAPMAGFTTYAFREMVRAHGGVGLPMTEMVCARSFVWLDGQEAEHPDRLRGVREEPRPLAVQIWDNDPQRLAEVGHRLVEEYQVTAVDINFGCPVKRITSKSQSGSYLLKTPELMGAIIERVVRACAPTPVTAKIRLGWSRGTINAVEVAKVVESAGAAALTVHGRVAEDYFRGKADWDAIARIKPHLTRIPLIGNGDLDSPESVVQAFGRYGVDGVMIGRAALGRPWLFRQVQTALAGEPIEPEPTLDAQREVLLRHCDLVVERFGPEKGTMLMRKYACCYGQGLRGARRFRSHASLADTPEAFREIVNRYYPRAQSPAS